MASIDYHYLALIDKIFIQGYKYNDPNRKGVTRLEIPHHQIIYDMSGGFPVLTTKKIYWKAIVGELLWFLKGSSNIKYLVDNNINIWNKDAYNYFLKSDFAERSYEGFLKCVKENDNYGDLGRIYGVQWRKWSASVVDRGLYKFQIYDQIDKLIYNLRHNPMSTRHIVTAWNPAELSHMALPPCHWSFEVMVEPIFSMSKPTQYAFTLKWHQRSVDTFLGLPFNIASYALLGSIISKLTGYKFKTLIGDLSNIHIYNNHMDAVFKQRENSRNKYQPPTLEIKDCDFTNINTFLNSADIDSFILHNYNSYPPIKAEMLPTNK